MLIAVAGHGITSWPSLWGLDCSLPASQPLTEADWQSGQKRREKKEQRVLASMPRKTSGLEEEHRRDMEFWERLFHQEVHGSHFTHTRDVPRWISGAHPLPIAPTQKANTAGMYVNRADEIGWMLLRTLPILQLTPGAFGSEWARQWAILDGSLRISVEALAQTVRRIGAAITYFVQTKFRFSPSARSRL